MRRNFIILTVLTLLAGIVYSCQSSEDLKQQIYFTNGRDLYIKHCQNCHGVDGEGLNKLSPPLTDTTFLRKNKHRLACFIKNGISDTVLTIHDQPYDGKMPDNAKMANIDLAQLIVFITNSYGNKQGMYKPEQVERDLNQCKGK